MDTYKELKSLKYIERLIPLAEKLLGITFRAVGEYKYSAYCPFHKDSKDSFRAYVNKKGDVRFHCFGACSADWDIYDIIQKMRGTSFREAQLWLAQQMETEIEPFAANPELKIVEPGAENLTDDEPISFNVPVELDKEIVTALEDSSAFYHQLLCDDSGTYLGIKQYLQKRGVDPAFIEHYQIGYAPSYQDEKFTGQALLKENFVRFEEDYLLFNAYHRAGLFRLLDDQTNQAYGYYRRFIDFSLGIYGSYGDYFAGKITFPIRDINGRVCGIMGRRPDNRGIRWIKQQVEGTPLNPKSWLYGIDKAIQYIQRYSTVILVEGIFDYFAFLRIFQDSSKTVVVSTLGAKLTVESLDLFRKLKVKNFIVAYDCDSAGKNAIRAVAGQIGGGCCITFLAGMEEGQDPADHFKNSINAIDGFSLAHLLSGAEKVQGLTDKPIHIDFISVGQQSEKSVLLSPLTAMADPIPPAPQEKSKEYTYNADEFLPLLTYNHSNKALLEGKMEALVGLIFQRPIGNEADRPFRLPCSFLDEEKINVLGPALILWLKIAIEQQQRKRRLKVTDSALADQLQTSRATISKYKSLLKELGYLNVDTGGRVQKLSVKYFIK